jgi:hypothetical protein
VLSSGHGKNGALSLLHQTVRPSVTTEVDLGATCRGIWAVHQDGSDEANEFHSYLVISLEDGTRVSSLDARILGSDDCVRSVVTFVPFQLIQAAQGERVHSLDRRDTVASIVRAHIRVIRFRLHVWHVPSSSISSCDRRGASRPPPSIYADVSQWMPLLDQISEAASCSLATWVGKPVLHLCELVQLTPFARMPLVICRPFETCV